MKNTDQTKSLDEESDLEEDTMLKRLENHILDESTLNGVKGTRVEWAQASHSPKPYLPQGQLIERGSMVKNEQFCPLSIQPSR